MQTFTTILTDASKIMLSQHGQIDKTYCSGYCLLLGVIGMDGRNVLQSIILGTFFLNKMKTTSETGKCNEMVQFRIPSQELRQHPSCLTSLI